VSGVRPVHVYVSPRGNAFMRDIAAWIAEAAALTGRTAELHADGSHPTDADAVNLVVAPHEFYLLGELDDRAIARAARLSIPVCTEQPGTPWFEITRTVAAESPLALDINRHGVAALHTAGIDAHHLRLGGTPSMVAPERARDLDVLFLGGRTDHRAAELARLAPVLWDRAVDLRLFAFSRPVVDGTAGLVFGADKYELLSRARVLVNIHRDDTRPGYFEWARMIEAMANGVCIVTDPVADHDPFVAGEHFVATDDLVATLAELLDDPDRCRVVGERARAAVLGEHPLTESLGETLDLVERTASTTAATREPRRVPRLRERMVRAEQRPLLPVFRPHRATRDRVLRAWLDELVLTRSIDAARCELRHGTPDHLTIDDSPAWSTAWSTASPEVSVVVTLYGYAHLVIETLDSIAATRDVAFEIVVVDDHSRDDGRDVVRRWSAAHPDVALRLVGRDANAGLPAARNLGFAHARCDLVMVMDADNLVYPTALRRLADSLIADPSADFAYSTLEDFGATRGVRSAMAWSVERLCESNYIDAQAMVRRATWERSGGYPDDPMLFGWEDWMFWLTVAARGGHGVHVPQMLGRYRTQAESMISVSNLFAPEMLDHVKAGLPDLPWPG
jgi:hypothetical protein